jgi:8-amino-7-oxononanoate synthase
MTDPLDWLDDALSDLADRGLRRSLRQRGGGQAAKVSIAGRSVLNFGSNDYLALAGDPRLSAAAAEASQTEGWGSGASALVLGRGDWHARLEATLAAFEGTEAALLFPTGFAANQGTIPALAERGDVIFSDELNHASIVDGCRLSRAELRIYRHRDVEHLERLLSQAGGYRRRLIVTDSLFSMEGDLAPLMEVTDLAHRHGAMLMVDEAHATGVFGALGRGVAEALNVADRIDVHMGTLSKALGSIGGFVAGSQKLIDWLSNRARSYVFSTAPPGATCAAALAAIDIVEREPFRREQLLVRASSLREALNKRGWDTGNSTSQIVPIIVGEPQKAVALGAKLLERDCFVPAIRPPSVPEGRSLLRISLSYGHDDAMIGQLLDALGSP